ncbi:pyridoxal-phosphate dependent enzyme [Thiocapsa marina]|uniref:Tryptophan synthase beta chain-like PALP domain-containing protein n=1 Tax=Thiocapsa marina 5811 TaxID=768671 RepID=F9UA23_9GAMM|nr:pyridoxal-phosphate dependent enzyme [Thiocapsa marina]EGV18971.1 hypothetical protein ThimaDRAFT_1775 [Thiocapsa marina 5811]
MTAPTIPRLNLAHLPTPIEPLPRLSDLLGGPRLFIKRDDQTCLALRGIKTRKLAFLVGEAQAKGARTLVTAGAWQSNHCRQTAAAAARCGMDCILVLTNLISEVIWVFARSAGVVGHSIQLEFLRVIRADPAGFVRRFCGCAV